MPECVTLVEEHKDDPIISFFYKIYLLMVNDPTATLVTVMDLFHMKEFQYYKKLLY
jgi:hypothetical protein